MYYVYFIQHSEIKDIYIGYTSDLKDRMNRHNSGTNASTKRNSGEWELVYYEAYRSEKDARERERKLKYHGSGKRKVLDRIINSMN